MNPAEVAAVYERAADEIKRRGGIHKGDYGDDPRNPGTCRVCIYGALNAVLFGDPFDETNRLPQPVEAALRAKVGNCPDVWNDAPPTTADDVIRLLRDLAREVAS